MVSWKWYWVLLAAALLGLAACTPVPTSSTTTTTLPPTTTTPPASTTPPTISPYSVNVATKAVVGEYLTDGRDRALYYTTSDRPNYSNLPDETLTSWPAFYTASVQVPSSLNAADFGTFTRDNGVKQTTFRGYPLYYFYQDKAPGDTLGNKLGNVWFLINPAQFPP